MKTVVMESREQLLKKPKEELREDIEHECLVALKQYFAGRGNGPQAKVASVVLTTFTRAEQAKNNARSLDLIEAKLRAEKKLLTK